MKKILIAAMLALLILLAACQGSNPGKYDSLAKCMTEKGVVEYGAFWCSNCAKVKRDFGKSFQYINYIECDPRGENAQAQLCLEKDVKKTPTWTIEKDGVEVKRLVGYLNPKELSEFSGCPIGNE